jgi:hypothetical protein
MLLRWQDHSGQNIRHLASFVSTNWRCSAKNCSSSLRLISAHLARYSTACKDPNQSYIVFAAPALNRNRKIVSHLRRINSNRHVSMVLTPIASRGFPATQESSRARFQAAVSIFECWPGDRTNGGE